MGGRLGHQEGCVTWPTDAVSLERLQEELAGRLADAWEPRPSPRLGGCFLCFARGGSGPGARGDRGWAAAVVMDGRRVVAEAEAEGAAGAAYAAGLLAAREGPLLAAAVTALAAPPEVVLVNATGRDHPRGAGLALHLGWALGLPTVGVTHRPLVAVGDEPGPWAGSRTPLAIEDRQVGWWVRAREGARPVAVSPGWRTDLDSCLAVVEAAGGRYRTPEPIRRARRLARVARSRAEASSPPAAVTDSGR
jgi:deoxyribonuclease V